MLDRSGEIGFSNGDRVMTPGGPGKVAYCRMAAPEFRKVGVYSVLLDSKAWSDGYTGTVYLAEDVKPVEE